MRKDLREELEPLISLAMILMKKSNSWIKVIQLMKVEKTGRYNGTVTTANWTAFYRLNLFDTYEWDIYVIDRDAEGQFC